MRFSQRLVRPNENRHPALYGLPAPSGKPGVRAKKIFIIKQEIRWPQTNAAGKRIRRILIFDNHPDTLRLVFGRRVDSNVHLSHSERMTSSGVALLWILVFVLMIGMVWPLL
jgi:hypothetical protein